MLAEILLGLLSLIPEFLFLVIVALSPTRVWRRLFYGIPLKEKFTSHFRTILAAASDLVLILSILIILGSIK